VLGQVAVIIGIGLAVGVATALVTGRLLSAFLYGIGPRDPLTLAAVVATIAVVALVASLVPAHRAAKIHPLVALRSE
jgi:ABC-type antimicrobial peptide transport system permease subunit